ncbi:MAG: ABC transporter substrate-binding protein [Deltaproteobacteria bacterium]|nr:ABC transporter substrate-binding protein [Deltaproteobacteria bacterium]
MRTLIRILCFITLFLVAGAISRSRAATLSNFATSITSESVAGIWVAKDRGFFRKHGLDVRFVQMPSSSVSVAALLAGEIDMEVIGPGHLLNAASGGADIVGIANLVHKLDYRFVSRPEIKTAEDLRGKNVAVSGTGAVSHMVALLALQKLGIDPKQARIAFLNIPGTEVNRRAALETGKIDATSLNGAVGDLYGKRGYTMLYNFRDSGIVLPQTVIATTRRIIATKPDLVDSYLKGFVEAIGYLMEPANKSTVMRVLASNLRLNNDAAVEEAYYGVVNSYERIPYISPEAMKLLHTLLSSINPKVANVRPETTIDTSVLSRLEASGFIKSVQKRP